MSDAPNWTGQITISRDLVREAQEARELQNNMCLCDTESICGVCMILLKIGIQTIMQIDPEPIAGRVTLKPEP